MAITWDENKNSKTDFFDLNFHEGTYEFDFNTRLIPNAILNKVKNHRVERIPIPTQGYLTVTDIKVTADGNLATVYFLLEKI